MKQTSIIYVSTFPPRGCGIATFTKDLITAMNKKFNPRLKSQVLAINDNSSFYNYDRCVKFQIEDANIEDYIKVAKKINKCKAVKLVNLQHEFGIFGGDDGAYIVPFFYTLKKPVVTTFHSVPPNPDENRKKVVRAIAKRSRKIIVMTKDAIRILNNDYGIPKNRIVNIHHGVHNIPFAQNKKKLKKDMGLKGKFILSTFGLINRGKGLEYVIKSLPNLIKKYPAVVYLIVGETHPQVRKYEGESYRNELRKLVYELKLKKHVKFYNKYLTLEELIKYLQVIDVYIAPALDKNQIVSGTLAYAVSAGKAIISTKSIYAKSLLGDERGILVDFKNPKQIRDSICSLIENKNLRKKIELRTYSYGKKMLWANVASNYMKVFEKIIKVDKKVGLHKLPKIKFDHLARMTDSVGILQHAKHSIPDRATGYTTDDNARALIIAVKHFNIFKDKLSLDLIMTYLAFLKYAQKKDGKFNNFLSYDMAFLDKEESEDSFGRAVWACGTVVNSKVDNSIADTAKFILDNALKSYNNINSPRAIAYTILGIYEYYKKYGYEDLKNKIECLSDKLVELYNKESSEEWQWFEPIMTYANGILPESLFYSYELTNNVKYLKIAKKTLDFLKRASLSKGVVTLIGHNGWYNKNGKRVFYDQQPVEAASLVRVFISAYKVLKKEEYYEDGILAFNWFLGKNLLNLTLYDETSGGCYDGLNPKELNLNQGAESTISYLMSRLCLEEIQNKKTDLTS